VNDRLSDAGDGTRVVHAGLPEPNPGEPFLPGPVLAAPYHLDPVDGPQPGQDGYGRTDNATWRALEAAIGELEGGDCVTFASGMAAVSAVLLLVARPGATVVLPSDGYYKTRAFARSSLTGLGVTVRLVPTAEPAPPYDGAALVLLESPANPGLDVCDIAALSVRAHRAGALVAVDNTTPTPLGQRPLELGADISLGSGTKALAGHSDLMLGYVCTGDPQLAARVRSWRDHTGAIPGPFEAWLAHRSLGTLDIRLARQCTNAEALAYVFCSHRAVKSVRWPGLATDPAHRLALRQMRRMPGVVTFMVNDKEAVDRFLAAARLITAATSFGGLHTTADRRAQWGDDTPPGLVRLSCGIEDTADLVADVRQALDAIV
jgi:cystathionine gamma-lyase